MFKKNYIFLLFSVILIFTSCSSIPPSVPNSGSRTLVLNNVPVSKADTDNGFTCWICFDYVYGGDVLFEVGYFQKNGQTIGFILYDGGYTGEIAYYSRQGLDYRWDWGPNFEYSIVIHPDGTALYYDFSHSEDGSAKPKQVYKSRKRYN